MNALSQGRIIHGDATHEAWEAAARPESILGEAERLVSRDRGNIYHHPYDDFTKVTEMAKALFGGRGPESADEHALYMILVKLVRLSHSPGHRDSIVDIAGYARTYDMVIERKLQRITGQDEESV